MGIITVLTSGKGGVGKSTFLNLITEQLRPDSGRVIVGQTIQFGFYTQEGMTARPDMRVIDIVKDKKKSK